MEVGGWNKGKTKNQESLYRKFEQTVDPQIISAQAEDWYFIPTRV